MPPGALVGFRREQRQRHRASGRTRPREVEPKPEQDGQARGEGGGRRRASEAIGSQPQQDGQARAGERGHRGHRGHRAREGVGADEPQQHVQARAERVEEPVYCRGDKNHPQQPKQEPQPGERQVSGEGSFVEPERDEVASHRECYVKNKLTT